MEYYYLIIVVVLFLLAISDLIVGVSNDAVNFLNSAIGSKAAPFKIVLFIASLGILLGAVFSSGMMEVARNGIFHPEMFVFSEVMLIFLAVMVTDVLLLDLFNTFGLPTSTTVSLVFGLLGSAVSISLMKISQSAEFTLLDFGLFINSSKAMAIVFSILASVIIGFVFGALIQYLARLLFTFKLRRTLPYFGAIWGGISVSVISYFIVFKGMKGSSLMPVEFFNYISNHTVLFMVGTFVVSAILLQLAQWIFKFNPLKFIVLLGTFALAMAFAGNDLVNFIGVPMAGLNSYQHFATANTHPDALSMEVLQGAVPTQEFILFLAGTVMLFTLWLSKKAKTVVKTTVDLSRQDSGTERFNSTPLSRSIVRMFVDLNETVVKIMPKGMNRAIDKRFKPDKKADPDMAFDMLRASVNLMVASTLIAFGTSLKLPLSTTYITFMVAMGTSLSDGAWGRETAVYRITGVFTVIAGWFVTALAAFTAAFCIAMILHFGGYVALAIIVVGVLFAMYRTQTLHKRREKNMQEAEKSFLIEKENINDIHQIAADSICTTLEKIEDIYSDTIEALHIESIRKLDFVRRNVKDVRNQTKLMKDNLNASFKQFNEQQIENVHYYVQAVNYLREISNAEGELVEYSFTHTNNKHRPLIPEQLEELNALSDKCREFFDVTLQQIRSQRYDKMEFAIGLQGEIHDFIDGLNKKQMKRVKNGLCGTKNSLLFSAILSDSKNMLTFMILLLKVQKEFSGSRKSENFSD